MTWHTKPHGNNARFLKGKSLKFTICINSMVWSLAIWVAFDDSLWLMFPAPFWASPSFHMLCPFNLMTSCKTPMRTPFGSDSRRRCDVLTSHESTHLCAWWTCTCVGLVNLKQSRTVKIYSYQDVCKQQAVQQVVLRRKNLIRPGFPF